MEGGAYVAPLLIASVGVWSESDGSFPLQEVKHAAASQDSNLQELSLALVSRQTASGQRVFHTDGKGKIGANRVSSSFP